MESALAIGVIIGIGNAVKEKFPQVTGIYGILLSVLLGLVFGYFNLIGIKGLEQGFYIGLASSGLYTVAKRAGGIK